LEIADGPITLCIDIRGDMMGDLPGAMADAHAAIKRRGAKPHRATVGAGVR
jgi:hypothetical protein